MCRSIKQLRRPDEPATPDEIQAAALQFVRKVSGFHAPSQANAAAFDRAVDIDGVDNQDVPVARLRLIKDRQTCGGALVFL